MAPFFIREHIMILAELVLTDFWLVVIAMLLLNMVLQIIVYLFMNSKGISRKEVEDMITENIINKHEIQEMIIQQTAVTTAELVFLKEAKNELTEAMRKTTEAVNDLKVELTALRGQMSNK